MTTTRPPARARRYAAGEPVWELAYMYPSQGGWSEVAYLDLPTNLLVEYTDGRLDVLPMPTLAHQFITLYLYSLLNAFVKASGLGRVAVAPLPVRLGPRVWREPDVIFLSAERLARQTGDYPDGADLVMEVVSGGREDRRRDRVIKRQEYAAAGIAEYWIVDPADRTITVLRLDGDAYAVHGRFTPGDHATSALLPPFAISVDDVFAAAQS